MTLFRGMKEHTTEDRLLNRGEVERRVGLQRSALYDAMRRGEFPEPLRVTARAVRWSQAEVEAWIAARPRATGDGIDRGASQRAS